MINKIKSLNVKHWYMIAAVVILVVAIIITLCIICNPKMDEIAPDDIKNIEVTENEMAEYRDRIGTDMDIKRAWIILFEDEASCRNFIENHGDDENPLGVGEGIIPYMEEGYYNIVGKKSLEDAYDKLNNGEYSKEPVLYSNMFCYLKRLETYSPMDDEKALKKLIKQEKYQELKRKDE